MKIQPPIVDYSISDIVDFRAMEWSNSKDFLYLRQIPLLFESPFLKPDHYCFGIMEQGQVDMNINNINYLIVPGSLIIYRPGQIWKILKVTEDVHGLFIFFNKRFLDSLTENIFTVKSHSFLSQGIQTVIPLDDTDIQCITCLFNGFFNMLQHISKVSWEPVARNLTSALIYETNNILSRYIDTDQIFSTKEDELFTKFGQLLTNHFTTNRSMAFYASRLFVTPDYLSTVVKKISGSTPTQHINQQVISAAKFQIGYTLKSIAEIANDLHFSDPFTFSRYFKIKTGKSPSQYRKNKGVL